jgi:integrase
MLIYHMSVLPNILGVTLRHQVVNVRYLWLVKPYGLLGASSEADNGSDFAFPRYNRTSPPQPILPVQHLNKWLKQYVPAGCTMHSFRHSMRDRLRAVQCPADITDQIGGWTTDGVGQGYGSGYPLSVLRDWLEKAK